MKITATMQEVQQTATTTERNKHLVTIEILGDKEECEKQMALLGLLPDKKLIQDANNYLSGGGSGAASVQEAARLWRAK